MEREMERKRGDENIENNDHQVFKVIKVPSIRFYKHVQKFKGFQHLYTLTAAKH